MWTPAPSTAVCCGALAECVADADLPPGVFNFVTGPGPEVGDELVGHPDIAGVGFIGSTATGLHIARRAAGKAQLLEMGGNGPLVVMDDADIEAAAEAAVMACFLCAGQSCTAGELLLVHEAVRDDFVARWPSASRATSSSATRSPQGTTLGPLNNEPVAAKMDEHVSDAERARRERGDRRRAGRRLPDRPLLAGDDPRRRARRRAGGDRGDVRPDRAGRRDLVGRGGDRHHQPLGLRPAVGDLHAATSRRGCASPTRSAPGS